jgi:hypothetical protein
MHEAGRADALEIKVAREIVAPGPQRLQRRVKLRLRLDEGAGRRRHAAANGKPDALRLVDNAVAFNTLEPEHKAVGLLAFVAQLDKAGNRHAVSGKAQNRMIDQRGFDRRNCEAQSNGEKAERKNESQRPAPQKDHRNGGNHNCRQCRPPGRFVVGCEIENDAAAERHRKPGKEPAGPNLGGRPRANARGYCKADLRPDAVPAPLRAGYRPSSDAGARASAHARLRRPY